MSADSLLHSPWLAAPLIGAAIAAGFGVILSRSLFALCMYLAAVSAIAAAAVMLLGAGDASLAMILFGVGWAPVLLMAAMLLSTRAAKPLRHGRPWPSVVVASAAAFAILWATPELVAKAPVRAASGAAPDLGAWPAVLVFVAAAACVGLLGYGERGALQRSASEEDA